MSAGDSRVPDPAPAAPAAVKKGMYSSAKEGLDEVREHYKGWTGQLTERSFELSLGVIAANWSVFGGVSQLLGNPWAKSSVAVVVVGLTATLLATWRMGELLRQQMKHAAQDAVRWEAEWIDASGRSNPWPFTPTILTLATVQRAIKAFVPIVGGLLFLLALLFPTVT